MGMKPSVAIVGLIWAGMALVGCENCKNCRNKYDPAPTFGAKAGTPVVPDKVIIGPEGPPTGAVGGAIGKADVAKTADTAGTKGFVSESPIVGQPVSTGSMPSSPKIQDTLRPNTDTPPVGMPGRSPDYLSGESPLSRSGPTEGTKRMPPRPVTPVGGTTTGGSESLPPLSPSSALPLSPLGSSIPPAPLPSSMSNNSLPGIETPSK
jgi:hypothetical protein